MTDDNHKQRLCAAVRVKQPLISGLPRFIELRRNQEQVYQVAAWRLTTACCCLTCSYELMSNEAFVFFTLWDLQPATSSLL